MALIEIEQNVTIMMGAPTAHFVPWLACHERARYAYEIYFFVPEIIRGK